MAPRAALRTLLGTDPEINQLGWLLESFYAESAPDSPPRDQRWAVIAFEPDIRAFTEVSALQAQVWFYQPVEMGRDYGAIDLALLQARTLVSNAEHVSGQDGWVLSAATWRGDSAGLMDREVNCMMRYARFSVAGRFVVSP